MNILDTIVAHKAEEIQIKKRDGLRAPERDVAPPRGFQKAIVQPGRISIIAEVKKASPSKGLLCPDFDPVAIARDYQTGGAQAVSVLTDERFFQGSLAFLPQIREAVGMPLLRKDFLIDHIQVTEAAMWGADAVLLIVAILEDSLLAELMAHAREKGLDVLVEVHDAPEMERAMRLGAPLIGVNNRNLKDFSVSLETTFALKAMAGDAVPVVGESGIATAEDMERLRGAGVSAALIGESLVKAPDRVAKLRDLIGWQ